MEKRGASCTSDPMEWGGLCHWNRVDIANETIEAISRVCAPVNRQEPTEYVRQPQSEQQIHIQRNREVAAEHIRRERSERIPIGKAGDRLYLCVENSRGGRRGRRCINKLKNCAAVRIYCEKLCLGADRSTDGSDGRLWLCAGDASTDHSNQSARSARVVQWA
jgi:hypothetical protein